MRLNKTLLSILALLTITTIAWLGMRSSDTSNNKMPPQISGTLFPIPKPIKPFQLTDHRGQRFETGHLKGHWSFLFFGYTHCSDICPTTLLMFKNINSKLEKIPDTIHNTQFILVSLDPERDSVEHLEKYIHSYHQDFIGLTGKQEQIKQFSSQFGIYYSRDKIRGNSLDDYLIDHSSAIVLINPNSEIQAIFTAPHHVEKITADFVRIRALTLEK